MSDSTRSWVDGANEPHGFGLNHLPYGAFRKEGALHLCARIGDRVLDLDACVELGLLASLSAEIREALHQPTLNALLALGNNAWQPLRGAVTTLLSEDATSTMRGLVARCLHPLVALEPALPIDVPGYTDFYASIDHARRIGELFRPDHPLLANYKHVPIAYNGRASSIVVSGTPIRRPWGQQRPASDGALPVFAPSAALDYECELAFVAGPGNALGEPIPIARASEHLFGVSLLNDWSARDIQSWEYQPLGPFLGKSFATTVSPWITPLAALEPFRAAARIRGAYEPRPLAYLLDDDDQQHGAFDIRVTTSLLAANRSSTLATANTRTLYWTPAQMLAHHTSNGCNLRPGDLLATGTISGPDRSEAGCLMELTRNGTEPITLSTNDRRTWLEDGDEVILTARCEHEAAPPITLGECIGRILPAVPR